MSVTISSRFDSHDMAERAMMRLRQEGVAFSLVDISAAPTGSRSPMPLSTGAAMMEAFSFNITSQTGILTNGFEPLFENPENRSRSTGEKITLRVSEVQCDKAREILTGSRGRDITVGK